MWNYNNYHHLNLNGPIPPLLSFDKKAIDEHLNKIDEEFNKLEEEITFFLKNYKKNI